MKMKNLIVLLALIFTGALAMSFVTMQDQAKGGPWDIPEKYLKMENPHKGDKSLERMARAAWAKHCRSCHGNTGQGDGPRAANLKTFPGDFKDAAFQKQTDGEIYYQSFIGRDEMPNFEARIPDEEERWAIVNLIRTMK